MRKQKIWRVMPADQDLAYIFRHELGISPVLARILANRGIATADEARLFLAGGLEEMYDPYVMADMDKAVHRIKNALKNREKILVYGDYDADGATATALLVKVLAGLGGDVGYYVPNRMEEGYGLHPGALSKAGQEGVRLVVTVDCGISATEEVAGNLAENGPDIIITDHHEPPHELPPALAVLNPKRSDCPYPFKDLAGVGVALKLAQGLLSGAGEDPMAWTGFLDLACLGTVADIVPLTGENRIIVKYGLPALAKTTSPGIRSLVEVAGLKPGRLDTREVGFALAPRLNAAGRMGDASRAVDLLLTEDPLEAESLAAQLHRGNQERQRIESLVLAEAMGIMDSDPVISSGRVIVIASPGWHPGVVGIVASRLVERHYKPVLLISLDGDEGKGSGRSIPGFHLFEAVSRCGDLLTRFGGHAQAVGFSIPANKVDVFRSKLNEYASGLDDDIFVPGLDLDAEVSLRDITGGLIEEINTLAPFGHCNPGPVLGCRKVSLVSCREIGKNGGHLKIVVGENGAMLDGIAFRLAGSLGEAAAASDVDVAFVPTFNEWRGKRSVQMEVRDIRPAGEGWAAGDFPGRVPGSVSYKSPRHTLKRLGPLAVLPEFIASALRRYRERSPNFSFPDQYLGYFSGGSPPGKKSDFIKPPSMYRFSCSPGAAAPSTDAMRPEHPATAKGYPPLQTPCIGNYPQNFFKHNFLYMGRGPESPEVPECRTGGYRWAALRALASGKSGSLVLVSSPGRAVEVSFFLNRSGLTSAFVHPGVLPEEARDALEGFSSGRLGSLACTYGCAGDLGLNPVRVILFEVPYSPGDLDHDFPGCVEMHRLFGSGEALAGLEYLESLAPGRDRLADLYGMIRAGKTVFLEPDRAAGNLRRQGLARAGMHTLAYGLAVFTDLNLIECSPEDNGYRVIHKPARIKKDLRESVTFRTGQEIVEFTGKWLRNFISC